MNFLKLTIAVLWHVEYVRKSFNPNAEGLAGLQWDSAELYMVILY